MELFRDEVVQITCLHSVFLYESAHAGTVKEYSSDLHANELIFFLSADNRVTFGGRELHDETDAIRFLPKGRAAGVYRVEAHAPNSCIDLYFDAASPLPDTALVLRNMMTLRPLFLKLYRIWNDKKPGYYSRAMAVVYTIIDGIRACDERYLTRAQADRLLPAHDYLLAHLADPSLNYREMARTTGLSYDYFKELFIRQYGLSPVRYVTALRIEKAKELLISGQYAIGAIAEACGFENVYYFSTVFKKQTGVSPSRYSSAPKSAGKDRA